MSFTKLFSSLDLGGLTLKSRMIMAPMTRARTTQPGNIPNEMMATYYAQRSSVGLIISEATQISNQGQGYSFTPGIFTPEHIAGWQKVTSAVHEKGGLIYNQLWHVGRMSHAMFHEGELPVAPSALAPDAQVWVSENGVGQMVDCPTPRALDTTEVKSIVQDYVQAAQNAIEAGFDGVEIHGANGYLIDQFLRTTSNQRTDEYGGSQENRLRFLKEIVSGIVAAIGSEKVGIRLSPFIKARGMACPEILDTVIEAAKFLEEQGIAYIHLSEADWADAPEISLDFRHKLRQVFSHKIIVTGLYTPEKAEKILQENLVDLVGFGRPLIANPDYPRRVQENLPLSEMDGSTLFGGDEKGLIDYPFYSEF